MGDPPRRRVFLPLAVGAAFALIAYLVARHAHADWCPNGLTDIPAPGGTRRGCVAPNDVPIREPALRIWPAIVALGVGVLGAALAARGRGAGRVAAVVAVVGVVAVLLSGQD